MEQTNHNQFIDKNLLVITPAYPNKVGTYIGESFVKNQVDELKKYFNKIIVIAPVPFSFKRSNKDKLCINYNYDNVIVYYPRSYYIPILWFRKILIDNRLKKVEYLIKKENINFDLIHAHFSWPSGYIACKLKEKYNTPVIITAHENSERFHKEINFDYPLLNYSWKKADALIRVNKIDVSVLKKFNRNILSIANGFNPNFKPLNNSECRAQLHIPMHTKVIFSLGHLIERKGFNYLINAIKMIAEKRNDVLCFIGGSGPLKAKLQKQIDDLGLQENIKLIGFVPDELLPIWMNACDVFVLPSLSEGNPTVMFECLGCGKPFIGTRVGGVPEIITSEDYGLLCDPANPEELAKNILMAVDKEWNAKKIEEYSANFTWDVISKEILNVYSKIDSINIDVESKL